MPCHIKLSHCLIIVPNLCTIFCCVVTVIILYIKEMEKKWFKLINNDIPFIFILIAMSIIKDISDYILWIRIGGILMSIFELFFMICIVYLICCSKKKVNNF